MSIDSVFSRGPANDLSVPSEVSAGSQQGFDIIKVLWRWKWLPILGAIIGAGVGYMYYTKLPPQYQSFALIQVVSPIPVAARAELFDGSKVGTWGSSMDEARAISGNNVLGLAVKIGDLEKHFPGQTAEQIVWHFKSTDGVQVVPADKGATQQLRVMYTCHDPELARKVVDSVVKGYQEYLNQEYKTVDTEVLTYFTTQQKELERRSSDLEAKLELVKKRAPNVMLKVDLPLDPYSDNYLKRLEQAERLKDDAIRLKSLIAHVEDARKKKRSSEELLAMLHENSPAFWKELLAETGVVERELESERLKRTRLLELVSREQHLTRSVGDKNPELERVRSEIEVTRNIIRAAEEAEARANERLQSQKAAAEKAGEKGPDYMLRIATNSMAEKLFQLQRLEKEYRDMAAEDLKKSHEFQSVIRDFQVISEEMAEKKQLLKQYSMKLDSVELAPKDMNQRILKEIDAPRIGASAGPYKSKFLLGGAAAGLLIMSGLAVLMDLADRSFRSPEEIVKELGLPVLGHIPAMDPKMLKKTVESVDGSVVTLQNSRGRVAEAYRSVRTSLFFSNRGAELKVVQVTSPVPGDGKSTLAANLAVALAQAGRKVLLIDADFRRPRIEKIFGLDQSVGMVQLLSGKAELDQALNQSCVPNLTILPGGKRPSNPAEILSSAKFGQMINILRDKFDLIIIDTPPVLAVSDPAVVSSIVDGVVVTMRLRRNIRPLVTRTLETLEAVDAPLLGIVVNGVSTEAAYGGYGYSYGYSDYRYSYRYSDENYRYGKYREYGAGYLDDEGEQHVGTESENAHTAT